MARSEETTSGIAERRRAALQDGSEQYQERRRELVRAAADVFREKGYQAATIKDIAARVGGDRASIYYYFGGKEELYQVAVSGVFDANLVEIERISELSIAAIEKLRQIVGQILFSYSENYPYPYVYIQEDMGRALGDSRWARQTARKAQQIESIIERVIVAAQSDSEARSDIPPDLATQALCGMLNWTHRWYTPSGAVSTPELVDAFMSIFWAGLRVDHVPPDDS